MRNKNPNISNYKTEVGKCRSEGASLGKPICCVYNQYVPWGAWKRENQHLLSTLKKPLLSFIF